MTKFYCSVGQRIELRPGRLSSNFNEVTNIFNGHVRPKYKNPFLSNRLHVKNERSECCLNILIAHTCRIKRVRKASFSQEQENR